MALLSSGAALEAILALAQTDMTLSQISRAIGRAPTTTSRALGILIQEHVVNRSGKRKSARYSLDRNSPLTDLYLQLARLKLPPNDTLRIIAASNPAIEFLGLAREEVVVVFTSVGRSEDQSRGAKEIDRLALLSSRRPRYLYHEDVRRRQTLDNSLRNTARRLDVLYGRIDRSFPDRTGHARPPGRLLHRPNSVLHIPSARLVSRLKKEFKLESLGLFGSAVRSDFRRDSDVDLVVQLRPNGQVTSDVVFELRRILEPIFERDVDIVVANGLRPEVLREITNQKVEL